jgi:hypothetical protein
MGVRQRLAGTIRSQLLLIDQANRLPRSHQGAVASERERLAMVLELLLADGVRPTVRQSTAEREVAATLAELEVVG